MSTHPSLGTRLSDRRVAEGQTYPAALSTAASLGKEALNGKTWPCLPITSRRKAAETGNQRAAEARRPPPRGFRNPEFTRNTPRKRSPPSSALSKQRGCPPVAWVPWRILHPQIILQPGSP